jgi:hypothetical protein
MVDYSPGYTATQLHQGDGEDVEDLGKSINLQTRFQEKWKIH